MRRSLVKKITLSILTGAILLSSNVVWADAAPNGWHWNDSVYEDFYVRDASNSDGIVPDGTYDKNFYGAYGNGHVSYGKVTITDGQFNGISVEGGLSTAGYAQWNNVKISGGKFDGVYVIGGDSTGSSPQDSLAENNTVDISKVDEDSIFGSVYGGYSMNGTVNKNEVILSAVDATFDDSVYGGYSYSGSATSNTVNISGGSFTYEVYGGCSDGDSATSNTVTIDDGAFDEVRVYGGYTEAGCAEENIVEISNVGANSAFERIIGGATMGGDANSNKVILSAVDAKYTYEVYGGFASGTPNNPSNASDNIVTISGGTFAGDVFGGFAENGVATNNTVNISGTANLENANLYGGYSYDAGVGEYVVKYGGAVTPNTLNIGVDDELKSQLAEKDITVDVGAWNKNKVKSIQGFDVINFAYVNWVKDGTVVEVTDKIELATKDDSTGIQGTAVTVGTVNVANGGIEANDEMHLLELTSAGSTIVGDLDELNSSNKIKVKINEGVATTYDNVDCAINKTANTIDLVIKEALSVVPDEGQDGGTGGGDQGDGGDQGGGDNTGDNTGGDNTGGDNTGGDNTGDNTGGDNTGGDNTGGDNTGEGTLQPSRNDQVLVLGESRAAAVAFTNQGSELIELGLNALARDNSKDTKVFAAVYGNHSEYETGSHVNVNGWSGIVGIGKTNANGLTVGAFFENGEGNYSTHNIFTADYIRGDGEACYNGGGLLVRKDNANGVYAEASLRAGNLQNELRNAVRNGQDLTGYDVDTFYYGAHIGIGKVIPRGADGDSLDVYGKFIYTHHDGETFDVGGTPTKFDSVESERLRLGFRLNEVQTNKLSMYYGAAWEYEFNGDAHDKIASFDLETPSLKGSTVIGEVGAHYKASEKWSLDLNARAYTGQREGFSGSVQANYSF